jgi:hypothetical protein
VRRFRFPEGFRSVPVFEIEGRVADVEVAVMALQDLRAGPRDAVHGKAMRRANLNTVEELMGGV